MNHRKRLSALLPILIPFLFTTACEWKGQSAEDLHAVLSPEQSLEHFQVEKGMTVKLVAAEPLISAPVAATFDAKGRLWVVEMIGYMTDTLGTGENKPVGKIIILEDHDRDGVMDERKVFMDSLVMPRGLCLYQEGVLVVEPPNLWFVKRNGDTAGSKYLVDAEYAEGGNVEHQPNGLLRGLDNWIYNAKSAKRYRRIGDEWEIQHTHFRGQWGITQDNEGRLFYNNNSANLLGDYFPPGLGAWNPNQRPVNGFNQNIVPDNRTYPIHATPGVNRGYRHTVLDSSKRLISFTAACGPLIYRGGALGASYEGNAFVAGPAANLVKRNILAHQGTVITGRQAYEGKEFLSSDDERFRPVNLYDGPDGALYVLDMYRGVIQHVTYLTPYLKNQIALRSLEGPLNCGRIYKVYPQGYKPESRDLSQASTAQLVSSLDDRNAWVRETAQHLLIDRRKADAEPLLKLKIQTDTSLVGRIHAFWTLEGLGRLQDDDIAAFLQSDSLALQQQAVAAAADRMNVQNVSFWLAAAEQAGKSNDSLLAPYLGYLASAIAQFDYPRAKPMLLKLAITHPDNPYVSDAIISGLSHHEAEFASAFRKTQGSTSTLFATHLDKVIEFSKKREESRRKKELKSRFAKGKQLFEVHCQVCHGSDGNGIASLGAPLNGSNWVVGDKKKLISIVLFGLTGPVKIGDKVYKQPEVADEMPGIGQNRQFSDSDIAQILSFIRNEWSNNAHPVTAAEISEVRLIEKDRRQPLTMSDLEK